MKEMQLKRGIIISAFQADYRMMVGNVRGSVPGGEFRAFSPVMLWALPIVLLSKAFSLLGYIAVYQFLMLPFSRIIAHTKCLISPQAESLTYHNPGHRPGSGCPSRSGHRPRLSATRSKPTASRSTRRLGSEHLLMPNHQHRHYTLLQKII